jgi:hypothetical protein
MPALTNLAQQVVALLGISPDQVKRPVNIMLCQHIQHARRIAQMRPVVEGQGHSAA